ncbi:MAG: glycosyltransferase family 2 protein [Ignavibacterium sp.]|nr:MAG: glycosyltransferase family 2 protein [Ignavibacterium sp.]
MAKTFDVIVPTMNNLSELIKCLDGFEKQSFREFKIFICVDGSTDGTIDYLQSARYSFEFEVLTHPGNVHKGRNETRNLSLNKITSMYVLMLDSDIVPDSELLQKHLDLQHKSDCISVGEVIYENRKQNIWAYYLQTRGKGKYNNMEEIPCYYLNTQNVSLKSNYFVELGGQDRDLTKSYGGDDTILGYQLGKKYGIPAFFNKSAFGFSIIHKTLDQALEQMKEFGAVNLKIIKQKYPELDKIFHFNKMESKSLYYRILRLFLVKPLAELVISTINIFPSFIKIKFVHFLVFYSIYEGYKTSTEQ